MPTFISERNDCRKVVDLWHQFLEQESLREIIWVEDGVEISDNPVSYYDKLQIGPSDKLVESLPAEPASVVEALKDRIVTKGPAATYTLALELQRLMHRTIKR